MKCGFLHITEAKPPTGQLSDLIQLFFLHCATSLCDHTVVVVLRVPPFKVHSFHPAGTNTLCDPDPFSFVPRDPLFSPIQPWWLLSHHCLHPPLAAQWAPVCRPDSHRQTFICREARGAPRAFCYQSPRWRNGSFLWFVPCHFLPTHTGYFSLIHFSDVTKVIQCLCH